jgi:hypothetical protein
MAEEILYTCIEKLNLIDVHDFCKNNNLKRDNIYKKIKKGNIPALVIYKKFYIIQNN